MLSIGLAGFVALPERFFPFLSRELLLSGIIVAALAGSA